MPSARVAAEEGNGAKSAFLATVSHEFRTPMNAVIGLIEVLRSACLKPSQRELVDTIAQAAVELLGIIDGNLELSKIEANRLELGAPPLSIESTFESAFATFA